MRHGLPISIVVKSDLEKSLIMSGSSSPVLFLVHGVGNTASGEMEEAVRSRYPGLGKDDVCEVVWNKVRDSIIVESQPEHRADSTKSRERNPGLFPGLALLKLSELIRVSKNIHSALQAVRLKAAGGTISAGAARFYAFLNYCWLGGMLAITLYPLVWLGWNNLINNLAAIQGVKLITFPSVVLDSLLMVGGALSCLSLVGDAVLTGGAITRRAGLVPAGAMAVASVILLRVLSLLLIVLLPITVLVNLEVFLLRMAILVGKGFKQKALEELEPSAGYVFLLLNTFALLGLALFKGWNKSPLLISALLLLVPIFHAVLCVVVKVLGDIFHYATDAAYRKRILQYFRAEVVRTMKKGRGGSPTIIIASHSLGTVIALDFLWNCGDIISDFRLTWLTGGSPIKRFFQRFFPNLFFPESINDCAIGLAKRFPKGFSWHNFYRPLDYIGSKLGLPNAEGCSENRVFRWFRLHTNYWGDKVVAKIMPQCLITPPYRPTTEEMARLQIVWETLSSTPEDSPISHKPASPSSAWPLVVVLLLLLILGAAFTTATIKSRFQEFERIQQLVSQDDLPRITASAHRSEHSHILPGEGTEATFPVYTFEYKDAGGIAVRLPAREDLFGNRSAPVVLCDYSKLEHLAAQQHQSGSRWQLQGIRLAGPVGPKGDFLAIDHLPGRPTVLSVIGSSFVALFIFGFVSVLGFFVLGYWIILVIQLANGGIGLLKLSTKARS